jgi:hypothetical protein
LEPWRRTEATLRPGRDRLAQLGQAVGGRVGRDRLVLERPRQRAPDEARRLLTRLADAEVDDVDPARGSGALGLGEAQERVVRHVREDRVQAHAKAAIVS